MTPRDPSRDAATEVLSTGGAPVLERRMNLVVAQGPDAGRRISVDGERFLIGKDPSCQLVVADPTVSRQHCEIVAEGELYLLRDLGSTNGTVVDGTKIKEAYLTPGSRIAAGNVELIFQAVYEEPDLDGGEDTVRFGSLVAASPAMRSILGLLRRVAAKGTTVFLHGETGVGKSALARALHEEGPRADGPLVVFDCAAQAPTLIESELFGAEKGAFTGAHQARPGACEQAQGGTLFLDEIGDLPLELQPKLLRVLEEKEVRRLGATRPRELDLHVIAASKADLGEEARTGAFRKDLYYRLAVIDVEVPPLRERPEDIPLLCDHFLSANQGGDGYRRLSPALKEQLERYSWPGNLRELRNVLERIECVGESGFEGASPAAPAEQEDLALGFELDRPFKEAKETLVAAFERAYLERLLERSGGKVAPAAREAGLNRKYFYDLLRKHGLHGRDQ